jgi:hypothetical protein
LSRRTQIACALQIVVALSNTTVGQATKIDPAWVYISQPLKWEAPPRKVHLEIKTAAAEIIVLYPSGQLSEVACLLIRQRNGKTTISKGDGEVVRAGSWIAEGDSLALTSRVVFRTVRLINSTTDKSVAEPEMTRILYKHHDSVQDDQKRLFAHLKTFDDFEFLSLLANEREIESDEKPN